MSISPQLILSDDPGVNYFINRVNTLEVTNINIPDFFIPVYTIASTASNYQSILNSLSLTTVNMKMNDSGSIRYGNNISSTEILNPLIPTSVITSAELSTTPSPNPTNIITLTKLEETSLASATVKTYKMPTYWMSDNKRWLFYYGNNIKTRTNQTIKGFALYYVPTYRPGFIEFLSKNPKDVILKFWQKYCSLMNNPNAGRNNYDTNCDTTNDIPDELKKYTQRINPNVVVPNTTPNPSARIVDTIKISKPNGPLSIKNIRVFDYNNNDITSVLSSSSKSCNFISSVSNPYLYIYIGDYYVKQVIIEGDVRNMNLGGASVELLNNTSTVYTNTLASGTSPLGYLMPTYSWNIINNTITNDALVSQVKVTKISDSNTTLNLSEVQLLNNNNKNLFIGKTIDNSFVNSNDNNLNTTPNISATINPSFTINLNSDTTYITSLSQFNIYNFNNINEVQNVVIELQDISGGTIWKSISLPGGYYTYTWDFSDGLVKFDALGAIPTLNLHSWYEGDKFSGNSTTGYTWLDSSGNNRNLTSENIKSLSTTANFSFETLNGYKAVKGTSNEYINFPLINLNDNLNNQYTLFTLARYTNSTDSTKRRRIFDGSGSKSDVNWLSGFWKNEVGVAYHNVWMTESTTGIYDANNITNWVLSSDQYNLYRANGVDRTLTPNPNPTDFSTSVTLSINNGMYSSERSDFSVVEIIYYNRKLSLIEIQIVERYLKNKYKLPLVVDNLVNPQPILAKKIKIIKPILGSSLSLSDIKILGNDNIASLTINSPGSTSVTVKSNTASSGSFAELIFEIKNNNPLVGDYIGGISIRASSTTKITVEKMLEGCYMQLLDNNDQILQQSDILLGGSSDVSWNVRDNSYKYFNILETQEVKTPTPQFLPTTANTNLFGGSQVMCPTGSYIHGIGGFSSRYGGGNKDIVEFSNLSIKNCFNPIKYYNSLTGPFPGFGSDIGLSNSIVNSSIWWQNDAPKCDNYITTDKNYGFSSALVFQPNDYTIDKGFVNHIYFQQNKDQSYIDFKPQGELVNLYWKCPADLGKPFDNPITNTKPTSYPTYTAGDARGIISSSTQTSKLVENICPPGQKIVGINQGKDGAFGFVCGAFQV